MIRRPVETVFEYAANQSNEPTYNPRMVAPRLRALWHPIRLRFDADSEGDRVSVMGLFRVPVVNWCRGGDGLPIDSLSVMTAGSEGAPSPGRCVGDRDLDVVAADDTDSSAIPLD
jgi:hypothetical protein